MARRKIRLAYITNESQRKASYKKRKKGLLKKLEELTILCGVEACAIMYSSLELEPTVWPSAEGVQHTIARFRSLPNVEQTRRMLNQESYVHERIQKLNTNLIKLKKENREKEMTSLMYKILAGEELDKPLDVTDLNDLGWVINLHLTEINSRIETLTRNNTGASATISTSTVVAAKADVATGPEMDNYYQIPGNTINNVITSNNMFPNNNNNVVVELPSATVGWNYESWAHYMNMENANNNQNDLTQTEPSSSENDSP